MQSTIKNYLLKKYELLGKQLTKDDLEILELGIQTILETYHLSTLEQYHQWLETSKKKRGASGKLATLFAGFTK